MLPANTPSSYPLPNQHLDYFNNVEDLMEDNGADVEDSHVVFVGGMFYGQNFKDRHPESEVTVIERDPLSAYLQEFAGFQKQEGYERNDIEEMMLKFEREWDHKGIKSSLSHPVEISSDKYEWVRQKHQEFVDSEWSHFDGDILDLIMFEPDYQSTDFYENNDLEKEDDLWRFQNVFEENCYSVIESRKKQLYQKLMSVLPLESRKKELREQVQISLTAY